MFKQFRRDPYFMLKYSLYKILLLGSFCVTLETGFGRLSEFNMAALWLGGVLLFVLPNFSLIYLSSLYFLALFLFAQSTSFSTTALWLTPAGMLAGSVYGRRRVPQVVQAAFGGSGPSVVIVDLWVER